MHKIAQIRSLTRRKAVAALGAGAVLAVAGGRARYALAAGDKTSGALRCVVTPKQTEGPYFVDEKLARSHIRSDPADGSVQAGVPLRLAFNVSRVGGGACAPLAGAVVDIWHCDALGNYSDVKDGDARFDTRGRKFLRGYQVTDAGGNVEFLTIYPGWYEGRAIHIHFKIRSDLKGATHYAFTSQVYFDEAVTRQVMAQGPYAGKHGSAMKNADDEIFQDGGKYLMLQLTKDVQGYAGRFDIGLKIA
jgi:protocatechuate 3,4-dioxygenase beta subunit